MSNIIENFLELSGSIETDCEVSLYTDSTGATVVGIKAVTPKGVYATSEMFRRHEVICNPRGTDLRIEIMMEKLRGKISEQSAK